MALAVAAVSDCRTDSAVGEPATAESKARVVKFEIKYLAKVRPFLPTRCQASSDRVLAHIVPFLGIRVAGAKQVIEESSLPIRGSNGLLAQLGRERPF